MVNDDVLARAYRDARKRRGADGTHPSDEQWERLSVGSLNAFERAAIMDHATTCEDCAALLRSLRQLSTEARAFDEGAPAALAMPAADASARVTPGSWNLLALAATAILALGGLVTYQATREAAGPSSPPAAIVARAPSPPVPPAWLAALPLEKAGIHVSPDDALVFRSGARAAGPSADELAEALEPYRVEAFSDAAARLDALRARYPQSDRVNLYYGVSLLFLSRPAEAVAPLRIATSSALAPVASDARWYLAGALARSGDLAGAATEADALCRAGGDRAAAACAARDALRSAAR
jgi:hypothetical protein